jgi:hypothetical protein
VSSGALSAPRWPPSAPSPRTETTRAWLGSTTRRRRSRPR